MIRSEGRRGIPGAALLFDDTKLPYLTADLPGIGGKFKASPEDFVVEEIPAYEAAGSGTHVFALVEKQRMTTPRLIKELARALGRKPRDFGYAGLKDAMAITRQWISIEHIDPNRVAGLKLDKIRIVRIERHGNKIKVGHLLGNRFEIKLRNPAPDAPERIQEILDALRNRGMPNYFGPQRFGHRKDNAAIGYALVKDDPDAATAWLLGNPQPEDDVPVRSARSMFMNGEFARAAKQCPAGARDQKRAYEAMARSDGNARRAIRTISPTMLRLYYSAVQSALFNEVLAARIHEIDAVHEGDMAYKHANGACFLVEDARKEAQRCKDFEISPTGPLFGHRMTSAEGGPGVLESKILGGHNLPSDSFRGSGFRMLQGARRPLRVPIGEPKAEFCKDGQGQLLKLTFELPAGAYATCLLRELCK
jgi:tRNA pseudouridine13 synthase